MIVPITRIEKPSNILGFKFVEFARVRQLSAAGLTQRDIAAELEIGIGTINRYLRIGGV